MLNLACFLLVLAAIGGYTTSATTYGTSRSEFDSAWKSAEASYENAIAQYVGFLLRSFTGLSIPSIHINASSTYDQNIMVNATVDEVWGLLCMDAFQWSANFPCCRRRRSYKESTIPQIPQPPGWEMSLPSCPRGFL